MITRRGLFKSLVGGLMVLFMPKKTGRTVDSSTTCSSNMVVPYCTPSTEQPWENVRIDIPAGSGFYYQRFVYERHGELIPHSESDKMLLYKANDNKDKGKLVNCYGESRDDTDEGMFICHDDGTIVANLEGYAIIPIEKWKKLTGEQV